jgi:hypothetical protein
VLGRTLTRPESAPARRAPTGSQDRMNRALALTLAVAFVLFGASIWNGPGLRLRSYPVEAVTFLENEGFLTDSNRLVHMDFVGNYIELRYGSKASVFIDDRYDMYPSDVPRDYRRLLGASPEALQILDDRSVTVVLWDNDLPLPNLLTLSGRWQQIHVSGDWVVLQRLG